MLKSTVILIVLMGCIVAHAQTQSYSGEATTVESGYPDQPSTWIHENGNGYCGADGGECGSTGSYCSPINVQHYLSLFGGFADIDNFERTIVSGNSTFIDGAKLSDGVAGGFAVGGQFHPYLRSEFEFTFRDNDASDWFNQEFDNAGSLSFAASVPANGDLSGYSGIVNAIFDCCEARYIGMPNLYLGGGLGAIYLEGDISTGLGDSFVIDNSSFAYQFLAGLSYPLRERIDLFTEYRYLGADYLEVRDAATSASLGDFSYDAHNVFFGVRFRR